MTVLYFLFSLFLLYCAVLVIFSDHPINSLLFLIGCFLNSSCLLLLFGLEFIALIFIAIYIGAIAIFFLFIIMMMNLPSYYPQRWLAEEYLFLGGLICLATFFKNILYENTFLLQFGSKLELKNIQLLLNYVNILDALGALFYTQYFILVILSGIILFFAMFATVILLQQAKNN